MWSCVRLRCGVAAGARAQGGNTQQRQQQHSKKSRRNTRSGPGWMDGGYALSSVYFVASTGWAAAGLTRHLIGNIACFASRLPSSPLMGWMESRDLRPASPSAPQATRSHPVSALLRWLFIDEPRNNCLEGGTHVCARSTSSNRKTGRAQVLRGQI